MSNTGRHRHVSIARRVALPSVIIAGAFVVAAVITGEVNLLRASSIAALSLGILVAALFDRELIRDRRAHGADRVNLARAYAVEYGGWIDERPVPDTAAELSGEDAVDAELEVEPAADAEVDAATGAEVDAVADAETAVVAEAEAAVAEAAETEGIVEEPAEEPAEQPAARETAEESTDDATDDATAEVGDEPAETTEAVEPAAVVDADEGAEPAETTEPAEDGELWDDLAEAPTVVNLAMWEERAREPGQEQPSEDGDRKLA